MSTMIALPERRRHPAVPRIGSSGVVRLRSPVAAYAARCRVRHAAAAEPLGWRIQVGPRSGARQDRRSTRGPAQPHHGIQADVGLPARARRTAAMAPSWAPVDVAIGAGLDRRCRGSLQLQAHQPPLHDHPGISNNASPSSTIKLDTEHEQHQPREEEGPNEQHQHHPDEEVRTRPARSRTPPQQITSGHLKVRQRRQRPPTCGQTSSISGRTMKPAQRSTSIRTATA